MASPSGRACEVSTKLSRRSICRSTSSSMSLRRLATRFVGRLVAFLCPLQQLLNSGLFPFRTIESEKQLGRTPQVQALHQFMADKFPSRFQTLQTAFRLLVVAIRIHQDLGGAAIFGKVHTRNADQSNARIGQFPLHKSFDFLAQSLAQTSPTIFQRALFQSSPLSKTDENIRKLPSRVIPRSAIVAKVNYGGDDVLAVAGCAGSQEVDEGIGHLGTMIVGDAGGLSLHISHQPVEIGARIRNAAQ